MVARSKGGRLAYASAGVVFVGLGVVGYIVPLMPGTVFFVLALFCFKRSSSRLEVWLLSNRYVGPTLRAWERDRSIRPKTKLLAIAVLWGCILVSALLVQTLWIVGPLAVLGVLVSVYIWTRKTSRTEEELSLSSES